MNIGDLLPEFYLRDKDGHQISSRSFIGKSNLVVYFYPKNETKVCTQQACFFRDEYESFLSLGCEVIGISSDSADSHELFKARHQLPFLLVSDEDKAIRKMFQVAKDVFGLLPGRYTYIFNKKGILVSIFHAAFSARPHIDAALKALSAQ